MTIEQLRHTHHAQPFQAYTLHMADGRNVRVRSPEFLAFSPSGRTISVATADDVFEIIDLLLVASIEVGNGVMPRRRRLRRRGR